jgi:hypothetical protein
MSNYFANVRVFVGDQNSGTLLSTTTPASKNPITTYNGNYIWYYVAVYKTSRTFDQFKTTGPNSSDTQLSQSKIRVDSLSTNSTNTNIKKGSLIERNNFVEFTIVHSTGTESGTVSCKPTFKVYQSDEGPNDVEVTNVRWAWGSPYTTPMTINFTTKKTQPTFPTDNIYTNIKFVAGTMQIFDYFYDKCTSAWAVLVKYTPASSATYSTLWLFDLNGNNPRHNIKSDTMASKTAKEKLDFTKSETAEYVKYKKGVYCGDTTVQQSDKSVPDAKNTALHWNPPTHWDARRRSHAHRIAYEPMLDADGNVIGQIDDLKIPDAFTKTDVNLGKIYQDINGAKTLNFNPSKLSDTVGTYAAGHRWGFRFMYNPTTVTYSTASNNSVDWTLGQSDPATLLAGNQNVTIELYLNRIPDMNYLRMSTPRVPEKQVYGRALDPIEREGILNRGTEYDIEFLYRVLNGDPLKNSLLLSPNYKGATADFGYTTGVPCWLQLNENLAYFGSVASFNVNHAMFTENMVPMLSTVSITFSRYPALWDAEAQKAFGTGLNATNLRGYLKSTTSTSGNPPA